MKSYESTPNFIPFYERYMRPLGAAALATHFQLFPGRYPGDSAIYEAAVNGPPSPEVLDSTYIQLASDAAESGLPFRRLRILPDAGFRGHSHQDVTTLMNVSQLTARWEDVRLAYFTEATRRIMQDLPNSPYAQEYIDGANNGISRLSFWTVKENTTAGTELMALRLMSYDKQGKLSVTVHEPPLEPDLNKYIASWEDTYLNHSTRIQAPQDTE